MNYQPANKNNKGLFCTSDWHNFFTVHLQIIRASISPTEFDVAALSAFEYPLFSIFSGVVLRCVSLDVDGNILLLWSKNWGHYITHLPRLTKILQVFRGTQNCQQCTQNRLPKRRIMNNQNRYASYI